MRIKNNMKVLGIILAIAITTQVILVGATPTYGSNVTVSLGFKYAYCWKRSAGDTVRAKLVLGGQSSDKTDTNFVQTNQISALYTFYAYMNYYVNGQIIASEKK